VREKLSIERLRWYLSRSAGKRRLSWHEAWLREHHDELEAERRRKHAEWMAEWRASMRRNREQIARNRRALERRKQVA
jgi:hypothetical protein